LQGRCPVDFGAILKMIKIGGALWISGQAPCWFQGRCPVGFRASNFDTRISGKNI